MNQTIKIDSTFTVQNIKVRVEGSKVENTQQPAIDLKLKGSVHAEVLAPLLGCDAAAPVQFWLNGTDGRLPAFPHMTDVKSSVGFDNCNIVVNGRRKFQAAKVDNFVFRIRDEGVVDLAFRLALVGLKDESSGYLCSLFHDSVDIEIESAQTELFDTEVGDDG